MSDNDLMNSNPVVMFGQSSAMMPFIHDYLENNGMVDINWDENKLDEKTALALITVNKNNNIQDFVVNRGLNSEDSCYVVGNKVVIQQGASYYSSPNAETATGRVQSATYGVLLYNGYLDSSPPLNPLKIMIMRSPIEKQNSELPYGNLLNNDERLNISNRKLLGGVEQGSKVYLRKEDVISSFEDICVSNETTKVAKTGKVNSQGIADINKINVNGSVAKQFNNDSEQEFISYMTKLDSSYNIATQKEEVIKQDVLKNLFGVKRQAKNMCFNNTGMFIKNLITDTIIYIPFNPSDLDESYTVSWAEANTRGSSHTVYGYEMTTSSSPSITFDFDVGALTSYISKQMYDRNDDYQDSFLDENLILNKKGKSLNKNSIKSLSQNKTLATEVFQIVNDYLNALKALAYPKYTNGIVTPPSCYISIANNFRFVGVCTNVSITHKPPILINSYNIEQGLAIDRGANQKLAGQQIFMSYTITLNFNKVVNQDFSADTVEEYGDMWTGGQSSIENDY